MKPLPGTEPRARPPRSVALSLLVGLALCVLLAALLVFSAGFDASKFIYVDF